MLGRITQTQSIATVLDSLIPSFVSPELKQACAKSKKQKPLSKLQWILLSLLIEDVKFQEFSNRSIPELANMSGYSERGVQKALACLIEEKFIETMKQTRGRNSVRIVTRLGFSYSSGYFRRCNKSASQSASQKGPTPYRVSNSSDHDNEDLLAKDSIIKMTQKEEEVFKALCLTFLDETIILSRIKRSHLSPEARFIIATKVGAAHYKKHTKNKIENPRAYYLTAIENYTGTE